MIVKSISHEQRRQAAAQRRAARKAGRKLPLRRVTTKTQAAHVLAASAYFMRPSKAGEKALGIEGHRVARTADYLVGDKAGRASGERLLHVAHRNFRSETLEEQQAEMIALMGVEPGSTEAFEHLVLSPGHGIVPSRHQMEQVPARLLELLGVKDHQAFVVWHGDTRNIHGHVGVSRIDPASGRRVQLGERWLLDTIGQAVAQIEYEQRWPSQAGAHYRADERGVFRTETGERVRDAHWNRVGRQRTQGEKRAQDEAQGEVRLSAGAAEYERHQRQWSDERIAQAIAWPIIRDARDWDGLHRTLAREGIHFETKGSGAQLVIGTRKLTATTANWAASIAKLTPKLGAFQPRSEDVKVAPCIPRRLDGADQRIAHKTARAKAMAEKDAERADITLAATDAAAALLREHQRLQQSINAANWVGRVDQLELARQLAGAAYRNARNAVEESRQRCDRAVNDLYRFPDFETWLHTGFLADEDEEERERRGRAVPGLILGADGRHVPPAILLLGYDTEDDDLERRYLRDGRVRFVDRGNRIDVADPQSRETVRDALLVAQAKWGSVQITGDRRFRELAADLAAELDIRVANLELQKRIAREQTRLRKAREARGHAERRPNPRARMLAYQWPLLREQNGAAVVAAAMRARYRVSVEDMLEPSFQAELRRHLEQQAPVMQRITALARTRPAAFRDPAGRLTLPDLGDPADIVRRQNWLHDADFARRLEAAVTEAETAQREAVAAADRTRPEAAPQVHLEAQPPPREQDVRRRPTATRGWNGITLKPDQRVRLLAAARQRLAAQDWDPADYSRHASATQLAAEQQRERNDPTRWPTSQPTAVPARANTHAAATAFRGSSR
jgi:hypothetical protein